MLVPRGRAKVLQPPGSTPWLLLARSGYGGLGVGLLLAGLRGVLVVACRPWW